jgi:hypothetical protein
MDEMGKDEVGMDKPMPDRDARRAENGWVLNARKADFARRQAMFAEKNWLDAQKPRTPTSQ